MPRAGGVLRGPRALLPPRLQVRDLQRRLHQGRGRPAALAQQGPSQHQVRDARIQILGAREDFSASVPYTLNMHRERRMGFVAERWLPRIAPRVQCKNNYSSR